jgi:integrase
MITSAHVRNVMKGITRQAALTAKADGRRTLQRHATAIDLPKLAQIVGQIPDTTTIGLRDRALLLVGFAGGFRRSELVGLTVEALDFTDAGIRAHLSVSKTDQTGEGTARLIRRGSTALDPVAALDAWLEHAGIESGPIFRAVDRHGNISMSALSDRAVAQIMKTRATEVGIDASNISGHSLRRGAATTARNRGADPISIARGLGWADGSTVLNRYFETAIEDSPNLGL